MKIIVLIPIVLAHCMTGRLRIYYSTYKDEGRLEFNLESLKT